ncbi:hypothetical protein, partial [Phormidesmis priestleyi]|uniref:hypothetical protein n=1 Tax=Phormidesmis priestleyi TaxID=268141 RepID=UPI001160DAAB
VETNPPHLAQAPIPFSMATVKRRALNQHLLERFIATLEGVLKVVAGQILRQALDHNPNHCQIDKGL